MIRPDIDGKFVFYAVLAGEGHGYAQKEVISLHATRYEAKEAILLNDDPGERRVLKVRRARGALFSK